MSAAPRDLGALAADLGDKAADAALQRAWVSALSGGYSGRQWRAMNLVLRQTLVTLATGRVDVNAAAVQPWEAFTPDERIAIGAMAREWRRQLNDAAGALR